jgi:hypothetical protein
LKREVGYAAFGLLLAVVLTFTYFQVIPHVTTPAAYETLRETSVKVDTGTAVKTTFAPMLSLTILVIASVCGYIAYSVAKKKSNQA